MKKLFIILFGFAVSVSAFGDIMLPPDLVAKKNQSYQNGLSRCPSYTPLYSSVDGKCYSCDTLESVVFSDHTDDCSRICPNRKIERGEKTSITKKVFCVLKETPGQNYAMYRKRGWAGWVDKCPDDKPVKVGNSCYPKCTTDKPLVININGGEFFCGTCDMSGVGVLGCEKCPNRKFIDGNCYQKCPDDYPVLASTGNCYKCDIAKTVIGIKILSGWEKCSSGEKVEKEEKIIEFVNTDNKQSNEIKTENVIPSKSQNQCPDDKPVLMFSGECAACDAVGKWDVVQSGCEKCNKKQDGHFCR